MSDQTPINVIHNPDKKRFEVVVQDKIAMVEYMHAGKNIIFHHTEVPPEFEGQGIANAMAQFALDWAKQSGYRVQALCPFIASYVARHPEYHAITWGY